MNSFIISFIIIQGLFQLILAQTEIGINFVAIVTVTIAVVSSIVLIGALIGLYYFCRAWRESRRARIMNDAMYQFGLWNEGNLSANFRNPQRPVLYDGYGFAANNKT